MRRSLRGPAGRRAGSPARPVGTPRVSRTASLTRNYTSEVIFKAVGDGRPYPEHGYTSARQWAEIPPRQVRLDELVTTKRTLDLSALLSEDSTFFGDLFPHVIQWQDTMYLEDGLHR